jgi:iron(II)-dependent oxidoreductase
MSKGGNSKPSEVVKSITPPSEGLSVTVPTTPAPTPIPGSSNNNAGSGFFGFFKKIFQEDPSEVQGDIPKKSQPEPVLEARLRPQDLPNALSSQMSEKDGAPMILIPAGKFTMGSDQEQIYSFLKNFDGVSFDAFQAEIPERQITLDAFYIDQYEVTYRLYHQFVEATDRSVPKFWEDDQFQQADHPVLGVTWYDAHAYCTWVGKRLPTEAEWEKAARGTEGYIYPWGNSWDPARTNTAGYWGGKTFSSIAKWAEWMQTALDRREAGPLNIGTFSGGISPYGVHDMAGNVSEWVSDWYTPYTNQPTLIRNPQGADSGTLKVHRGGSWSVSSIFARTAYRARENPERGSPYIGIRCAKTSK